MKRVLFIDRDGTIIREPDDLQIDSLEKIAFLPGAITNLARIAKETDLVLVMVSNQDGMGTASFPESSFIGPHEFVLRTLAGEGVEFADVFIDSTLPEENAPTRKPGVGMLGKYLQGDYDLANSWVIGDRPTDIELGRNLGCRSIYIRNPLFDVPDGDALLVQGWNEIYDAVRQTSRKVTHRRTTAETDIAIVLDLDGRGTSRISTGLRFLDHMLDQLAKHGSFDLQIDANGDLDIDEHHTVEDVAITLGETFAIALREKRGLSRYGFCLPMDDCLAQVAVDLGGRNWIVWEAEFTREMIGDVPTELWFHFFKSFSDKALCNLNIKAEGTIEHHKIEAIFKAFARALRMAVRREGSDLPTTKGFL
jgi:imidazoleglycerol-phosphate dehydratase/histidinol-phosphatase